MIRPRWFSWRNKHIDEHLECDDAHDRAVFAAGYLLGGGDATHFAAQINPAFHDVLRLLILMMTADELTTEQLGQAVADEQGTAAPL